MGHTTPPFPPFIRKIKRKQSLAPGHTPYPCQISPLFQGPGHKVGLDLFLAGTVLWEVSENWSPATVTSLVGGFDATFPTGEGGGGGETVPQRGSATGWSSLSFFGTLIHAVGWRRSGRDTVVLGNLGVAILQAVLQKENEASSLLSAPASPYPSVPPSSTKEDPFPSMGSSGTASSGT